MKKQFFVAALILVLSSCVSVENAHCDKVINVQKNTNDMNNIISTINVFVNVNENSQTSVSEIVLANKLDRWYVVSVGFDNIDPGIFIIEKIDNGFNVLAELSGNLNETGDTEKFIRDYFANNVPTAPKELLDCSARQLEKYW